MKLFKKIALASAFSPRFLPLLGQAKRFADLAGESFSLIHAGAFRSEDQQRFLDAFDALKIDAATPIHWVEGDDAAAAITGCVAEKKIDLLIAGALKKHVESRHFISAVSRQLLRHTPLSLLLFTDAPPEPQQFKNVVVITDFSPVSAKALKIAIAIAEEDHSEALHVVRVFTIFSQARASVGASSAPGERKSLLASEEEKLRTFVEEAGDTPVPIETRCAEGTTGFAASDYVQSVKADLLVLPAKAAGSETPFPEGMDWIFQVIPTNLLLFRDADKI